jgi:general transcription factor IIIA
MQIAIDEVDSASECGELPEVENESEFTVLETPPTPISRPASARPKRYICTFESCNKAYARPKALSEHMRSHTNERPYKCSEPDCVKTFRREDHLRRHIQIAHKNERNYVCTWEGCEKRFCDSAKLKTHIAVHEGREKFKCTGFEGCHEWFRKRETLRAHITAVHHQRKPYPCDYVDEANNEKCDHGYTTALKLAEHKKKAHEPARFHCQTCQENVAAEELTEVAVFPSYALLQSHIRAVHPPTCKHCNKPFVSTKALSQHIELAHSTADNVDARRTFTCDFPNCHGNISYGFTRRSNLSAHARQVHEGARPFICGETDLSKSKKCFVDGKPWSGAEACGKACQTKHHLEEHVRTAHLGLEWSQVKKKREMRTAAGLPVDARRRPPPSALSKLTGHGYGEELGRNIACLSTGCDFCFFREYDARQHCQIVHGMAEVEYMQALREKRPDLASVLGLPDEQNDDQLERELDEMMGITPMERVDVRTGEVTGAATQDSTHDSSLQNGTLYPWLVQNEDAGMPEQDMADLFLTLDPLLEAHDGGLHV